MQLWPLLILLATAEPPKYRSCSVSIGEVLSCSATGFTGQAVKFDRGLFRSCSISIGERVYCGESFSGEIPLYDKGKVVLCKVQAGNVVSCSATGFSGEAVLMR